MRIGILFGGKSREREISFAGGRTVYDLLDKSLFTPVPIFIDSLGNFILLEWSYLYKGSIRDFYPPTSLTTGSKYQVYMESLRPDAQLMDEAIGQVGTRLRPDELAGVMDFAFLALHGPYGEDGSIQGILDYYNIPYSGSGILPSAIGIDKIIQKDLMRAMGVKAAQSVHIGRQQWTSSPAAEKAFFEQVQAQFQLPVVIKASTQGSSIGVSILKEWDFNQFRQRINQGFFIREVQKSEWAGLDEDEKIFFVQQLSDIYEGTGIPFVIKDHVVYHPEMLREMLDKHFAVSDSPLSLSSIHTEPRVLVEEFIEGKEFSCIVIEDEKGQPLALPPTEIIKSSSIFDYRAKYLPGISRKVTPIDLPEETIDRISSACEHLYQALHFDVYARIDGLIKADGSIYLNDPNTTSGMLPSSFFFHQAAEIGLSPSQFLTYIIHKSLQKRLAASKRAYEVMPLLRKLEQRISDNRAHTAEKPKVAVVLGGISSERHISVESGRNVFEKLSSSGQYTAYPVFLTEDQGQMEFYILPMNLLLKDNADDIREKARHYKLSPVIQKIIERAQGVTSRFAAKDYRFQPQKMSLEELKDMADVAFIALHGRPGEDGTLQKELEKLGMPYNGSSSESSAVTINKYLTNEILRQHGFLIPDHKLITCTDWEAGKEVVLDSIEQQLRYPVIAKPADDGCSSAVKKIRNRQEMLVFADTIFRNSPEIPFEMAAELDLKPNEEFPQKDFFVVEELVSPKGAKHFLEITGGMLTHMNDKGELEYEVFEPSEALAEKGILSLEEKFLAGEGQNITPARFPAQTHAVISRQVRDTLEAAARVLKVEGYCRIDAFVRIFTDNRVEVVFIEVNSLPGLTPATCIFHQAAISGYKPFEFLDGIIKFGIEKTRTRALPQAS